MRKYLLYHNNQLLHKNKKRKFRKLKSTNDHENFKRQRNKVNVLTRKAKNHYHQTQLKESASNPEKFWRTLKSIFPIKEKVPCTKSFLVENNITTDSNTIANTFCTFFTDAASKVKSKAILLKDLIWAKSQQIYPKTYNNFRLKQIQIPEIYKQLRKLQKKKASGNDNLPPCYLKDIATCLAEPLCYIINLSIKTGIVPSDFKHGRVIPVYKSGSKSNMDNYRPITVLPACYLKDVFTTRSQIILNKPNYYLISNLASGSNEVQSMQQLYSLTPFEKYGKWRYDRLNLH